MNSDKRVRTANVRWLMLFGVLLAAGLVFYGKGRFPHTSLVSLSGAILVLAVYGIAGWLGPARLERMSGAVAGLAGWAGLLAGAIFTAEILLEYVLLPKDNTRFGLVEFGLVFAIYFAVGAVVGWWQFPLRLSLMTGMASALLSSLIWYIAVLGTFYAFFGTERQAQVFRAEGNYEDFARSGMADFNTFVMEDFLGAGFFHLLLGPIVAGILASLGGLTGKGLARICKSR